MSARRAPGAVHRAVVFDLDEALIDARAAWRYTLEEALMAVANRRIDARPLAEEYRRRPWRDSLAVVLDGADERRRAEALCGRMAASSALKRLLVHEGAGMALDEIRGARIEIGAASRAPHGLALKQAQATGLDRFLAVLSATPEGAGWDPAARAADCLAWFARPPGECLFVGIERRDLEAAGALGMAAAGAAWAETADAGGGGAVWLAAPDAVVGALLHGIEGAALSRGAGGG